MSELEYIKRDVKDTKDDVHELSKVIYTLIEAQKNTTKNVDALTSDTKSLVKLVSKYETIEIRMKDTDVRIKKLEEAKTWTYRTIIGAVIGIVVAAAIKLGGI